MLRLGDADTAHCYPHGVTHAHDVEEKDGACMIKADDPVAKGVDLQLDAQTGRGSIPTERMRSVTVAGGMRSDKPRWETPGAALRPHLARML